MIIPCYNSAWSIERTLKSIFAQRFENYEAILIDDGSTDDLHLRIEPFSNRMRTVRQSNQGLAAARNRGIAESLGELVAPLDADDLWHPDYLVTLVQALDNSSGSPFAYAGSFRVDESDSLLADLPLNRVPRHDFAGLVSLNSVGNGSAAVFRKNALMAAGGYDRSLRDRAAQGAEDWKLIVRLAATGQPVFVPRKLVAYRLTARGMSQDRPERQLMAIDAVIADLKIEFPDVPSHLFADARTMMTAWLLPAFLRKGMIARAVKESFRAYALNILWWRNANLRLVHRARLGMALKGLMGPPPLRIHLKDFDEDGYRPFAFLNPPESL